MLGGCGATDTAPAGTPPAATAKAPATDQTALVADGQRVRIVTARGGIEAHALVTPRIRPLIVDGRTVHQIALPWHFGPRGLVTGDVANDLIPMSEEPNVKIMESKALLCRVEKV